MAGNLVKRIFDLAAVILAAPLWLPVVTIVALAVRMKLGTPVFFRQPRSGFRGVPFDVIKFRTMKEACDGTGQPLPDHLRLTSFGRWLRETSLDELPELWNVVLGQMSLVGPRPLVERYYSRYSPRQRKRLDVRPGLTGLAQIMGRNALSWDEKFEWDARYVATRTFWLDLKILLLTLKIVVLRDGISAQGEATMPEFFPIQSGAEACASVHKSDDGPASL
jgi:lipopolysaccharide/colanic/teichoic acid biosynthesis glycosyltransferase